MLSSGPACSNASALFYSERVIDLLTRIREDFDAVLFDTPPMLQVPDARVLGRWADGVVLVLRAGETTAVAAAEAAMRLQDDGTRILGTILNSFDARSSPYKYYSGYHNSTRQRV